MPALTAILTRYITQYTHRSISVNKVHNIITTYVPKEFFKRCYCSANLTEFLITVSAQIEQRCSNFRPEFFGAVAFKFGKSAVIIKMLL